MFDISEDGTIMVGSDYAAIDTVDIEIPLYFDMAKDTSATRLPLPTGYENGDCIVGTSYDIAFIKFKNDEMWSLQDWLEDEGLATELADWELYTAACISDDGHWIAGTGRNGAYVQVFRVYLP
ncbi:MAG: hypothetical protein P9L89_05270 [Candidatus Celaenobacter polaris]|nr:hypothetical protein [Candidatus Celaenobacter polaris]